MPAPPYSSGTATPARPELAGLVEESSRELPALVDLFGPRPDHFLGESPDGFLEKLLLFAELDAHGVRSLGKSIGVASERPAGPPRIVTDPPPIRPPRSPRRSIAATGFPSPPRLGQNRAP